MAGEKNTKATANAAAPTSGGDFDYEAWLKSKGHTVDKDKIEKLTGLLPIFNVDHALAEKWDPWHCLLVAEGNVMFNKAAAKVEDRMRPCFVVKMLTPSTALYGAKGAALEDMRESRTIKAGDYALVPITGSLKNLQKLQAAAANPDLVFPAIFRATGREVPVAGRPQPMKEIESILLHEPIAREGDLLLTQNASDGGRVQKQAAQLPEASPS